MKELNNFRKFLNEGTEVIAIVRVDDPSTMNSIERDFKKGQEITIGKYDPDEGQEVRVHTEDALDAIRKNYNKLNLRIYDEFGNDLQEKNLAEGSSRLISQGKYWVKNNDLGPKTTTADIEKWVSNNFKKYAKPGDDKANIIADLTAYNDELNGKNLAEGADASYYAMTKAKRLAKKDGHDFDKLPKFARGKGVAHQQKYLDMAKKDVSENALGVDKGDGTFEITPDIDIMGKKFNFSDICPGAHNAIKDLADEYENNPGKLGDVLYLAILHQNFFNLERKALGSQT
jgi:hypothetical protein